MTIGGQTPRVQIPWVQHVWVLPWVARGQRRGQEGVHGERVAQVKWVGPPIWGLELHAVQSTQAQWWPWELAGPQAQKLQEKEHVMAWGNLQGPDEVCPG